jgi:hypothetical protein
MSTRKIPGSKASRWGWVICFILYIGDILDTFLCINTQYKWATHVTRYYYLNCFLNLCLSFGLHTPDDGWWQPKHVVFLENKVKKYKEQCVNTDLYFILNLQHIYKYKYCLHCTLWLNCVRSDDKFWTIPNFSVRRPVFVVVRTCCLKPNIFTRVRV